MTAPDAERFDALASIYDQVVPFFGLLGERLVQWTGPTPGQRVLDLGAGRGAVTSALSRWMGPAADIVAGDVSTEMLSLLRALELPGVAVKYVDATAIDEPDGSFDLVCSAFVLHFLADRARALTEVARVLRPTGTFVMSVPGPGHTEGWWVPYGQILDEFRERAQFPKSPPLPRDLWDEMAVTAGLRLVDRATVDVCITLDGPEQHWDWLLAHSHRGFYNALDEQAQDEFRERVLQSLRTEHPTGGTQLLTNADFYRMTK
jgi:SAM-dependent methyltransferase